MLLGSLLSWKHHVNFYIYLYLFVYYDNIYYKIFRCKPPASYPSTWFGENQKTPCWLRKLRMSVTAEVRTSFKAMTPLGHTWRASKRVATDIEKLRASGWMSKEKKWSQGISSLNSKAFLRLSSYYSCWILLTPIILNLQVSISPNDKIPYQALTTETFFQGGTPSFPQILNNIMVWMVLCTRLCCGTSGVKKYLQTVDPPFCG